VVNNSEVKTQSLIEHLEDLRRCLLVSIVAFFICTIISYIFSKYLFRALMLPLLEALPNGKESLHFTGLVEPFFVYLKTAAIAGLLLSCPVILHQLWSFIAPGLYANEKKIAIPFVLFGTLFFLGGALFGYFVVFPTAFKFLLSFIETDIQPILTIKEYLSLAMLLLFAFGLVFELPLFMFFLSLGRIVTPDKFKQIRKYAYLGAFVVAALLTPPDVVTQIMMGVPACLLWEVGILFSQVGRKISFGRDENCPEEEDDKNKGEEGMAG